MSTDISRSEGATRVLHVDDDQEETQRVATALDGAPGTFEVVTETDPGDGLDRLAVGDVDCLIAEYDLAGTDGVEFLKAVRETHGDVPFILFTGAGDEAVASRAISAGATDYVRKGPEGGGVDALVDQIRALSDVPETTPEGEYDEAQLERFMEVFPDVVLVIEEDGRCIDLVAEGEGHLLYEDPERLVGQRFHDVYPESTADRFLDTVRNALDTGEQQRIEYQLNGESGQRWFEARVGPTESDRGTGTVFWIARDITERKRREREYEQIFNSVNDSIVVHDPETTEMVDANSTFRELIGYDRETVLELGTAGISVTEEGFTPDRAEDIIAEVMETGEVDPFEWKIETSDGDHRLMEVTATRAKIGGELRHVSLMRDITQRRQREREYEQIFDSVNDAITVFDPDAGEITEVNDAYREMLGYDLERIQQLGIEGLSATDEGYTGERGWELIREVAETGESETVEWRGETRDGDRLWLEATLTPAEIGGEQRVLSIQRDITERRELERTYQDIFEGVSDGLVVHDGETGEILEVNEQYCELTGYDREELLKDSIELIMPEDDPEYTYEDVIERIHEAREEGPQLFEFKGQRKDGETFIGDVHLRTIEIRGTERVLASVRDITERKRREREYEQIFDGVNDAIVIQDPETAEPIDANETFLDRLGYDDVAEVREEGLEGLSVTESGYTKKRAQELCRRVMETGESEVVEWQQETKDGKRRWIEATIDPAVIQGKDRVLSMQRDITERKRRQRIMQNLHASTNDLQEAESVEEVCEATVEAAKEVLDLSMPTCWIHGFEDPEVLSPVAASEAAREASWGSDGPWEFEPGDFQYEAYETGETRVYDPSEILEETPLSHAVLIGLGDHGMFGAAEPDVDTFDDATLDAARILARHATAALDRVERERELRESERRFRLIAERIDEVIYLATPDFSEVLYVNPAYETVWGRPIDELYDDARQFLEAVDPRDRDETEAEIEAMVEEIQRGDAADSYDFEYRIRQPGGEIRWVSATGYAVEVSGDERRFVGIVEDITERKYREQRLEVFNRILRHNLRNQLDVIRSHAETLIERYDDSHPERIVAAVDELAAIGARARKTDRIMSMGDGASEVSLPEVLGDVVEEITREQITVDVVTDLPASARLTNNDKAFRTAVKSALENAIEYADSEVELTVEDHPEGYTVIIEDDGPGIPEEELIPIEAGTETNLNHGRGLGLWQLRWGVDKLNGELSFDTNQGTTIRIRVPDRDDPALGN